MFENYNFTNFWEDSKYAKKEYIGEAFSEEDVKTIEKELGYCLPKSYIYLMKKHNGGIPIKTCYPTKTSLWRIKEYVAITGIMGLDKNKPNSLLGEFGSKFWINEWGYPNIGVAICDTPSGGHDMIFLDYRECGPTGEPRVVHIDQENDYEITVLADDFESFIIKLKAECDVNKWWRK